MKMFNVSENQIVTWIGMSKIPLTERRFSEINGRVVNER